MSEIIDFKNSGLSMKECEIGKTESTFPGAPYLGIVSGFNIVVMENNFAAAAGKGLLLLSSEDYKTYVESLKIKS